MRIRREEETSPRLTVREEQIISLCADGMLDREIAEQLNLSVRTVDKHLELALKELRKYLNIIPAIIVFLDILP